MITSKIMTRINAGIPPIWLTDKHLIAEHREITRIPNAVTNGRFNMFGQPDHFTFGEGHVKFFYDKLDYLRVRYYQLYLECEMRGFDVTWKMSAFDKAPKVYMNWWSPDRETVEMVLERLIAKDSTGHYESRYQEIHKECMISIDNKSMV